jgi:hypothetical protein
MPAMGLSAATDLGLGSSLSDQVKDETEEEKRRKRLGLDSPAVQSLFGMSPPGLAAGALGMGKGAGRY